MLLPQLALRRYHAPLLGGSLQLLLRAVLLPQHRALGLHLTGLVPALRLPAAAAADSPAADPAAPAGPAAPAAAGAAVAAVCAAAPAVAVVAAAAQAPAAPASPAMQVACSPPPLLPPLLQLLSTARLQRVRKAYAEHHRRGSEPLQQLLPPLQRPQPPQGWAAPEAAHPGVLAWLRTPVLTPFGVAGYGRGPPQLAGRLWLRLERGPGLRQGRTAALCCRQQCPAAAAALLQTQPHALLLFQLAPYCRGQRACTEASAWR